jgi:hypothetical protein
VSFVATNPNRELRGPVSNSSQRGHRVALDKWMADEGKTASHEGQDKVLTVVLCLRRKPLRGGCHVIFVPPRDNARSGSSRIRRHPENKRWHDDTRYAIS